MVGLMYIIYFILGNGVLRFTGEMIMNIVEASKKELIDNLLKILVTPNIKKVTYSEADESNYDSFIKDANRGKEVSVKLPLDFAIRDRMFNLIKEGKVFIESSVKFVTHFTSKKPDNVVENLFMAKYHENEFYYSFLDNHPGIINVDKLKDIPIDYEGLMAVPPTVLEYKNIKNFNIHRVLYTPKHNGKIIYPRVVISNKCAITD